MVSGSRLPFEQQILSDTPHGDEHSDSTSEGEEGGQQLTELQMRLSSIRNILDHLNKLSFLIRNPALRQTSAKGSLHQEIIRVAGEEENTVEPVSISDEAREYIVKWLNHGKDCGSPGSEPITSSTIPTVVKGTDQTQETEIDIFDKYAKLDELHMAELFRGFGILATPDLPSQNRMLIERLTRAVTNRRRQFRYWVRHAEKLAAGFSAEVAQFQRGQSSNEVRSLVPGHAQAGYGSAKRSVPDVAPSAIYPDTEVTALYDKRFDDKLEVQSMVSYASTTWDVQGRGVELPPPPRAAAAGNDFVRDITPSTINFAEIVNSSKVCPYCSVLCPAKYGRARSWK